ncbi:hypothetical protein AB0903_04075 [Streptomyces sp. NPDC048389]|uniref:hypothetical protein n=1 Tax=Streptomyces sp. NPDC048389 TaxID=3154622 RepID=UPI003454460B
MAQRHGATYRMITGLPDGSRVMTLQQPTCVSTYVAAGGLQDVLIHLCGVQQHVLRPLTGVGPAAGRA